MNLFERFRRWLDRSADPEDLHASPPEDAGASTGVDRPFPAAGPVADPPVGDPPLAGPPERPLG
ncbi:MAG TPA: hypothetical protein VK917_09655 [Ilumatobacter sp.]|nr:hypothetical protein [Ilumatobacter sp.]